MQISVGASSELCQKGDESFHGEEKTSEGEGNGELISLTPRLRPVELLNVGVCFILSFHPYMSFFFFLPRLPVYTQQFLEQVLFVKLFYTLSNSSRYNYGDTRMKMLELCTDRATDMQPFTSR